MKNTIQTDYNHVVSLYNTKDYKIWYSELNLYNALNNVRKLNNLELLGLYTLYNSVLGIAMLLLQEYMKTNFTSYIEIMTEASNRKLIISQEIWRKMQNNRRDPSVLLINNKLFNPCTDEVMKELEHIKKYL